MTYRSLLLHQWPESPEANSELRQLVATELSPRHMQHSEPMNSRPVRSKHSMTIYIYTFN